MKSHLMQKVWSISQCWHLATWHFRHRSNNSSSSHASQMRHSVCLSAEFISAVHQWLHRVPSRVYCSSFQSFVLSPILDAFRSIWAAPVIPLWFFHKKHLSSIGPHEIALHAEGIIYIAMSAFSRVTLQASIPRFFVQLCVTDETFCTSFRRVYLGCQPIITPST